MAATKPTDVSDGTQGSQSSSAVTTHEQNGEQIKKLESRLVSLTDEAEKNQIRREIVRLQTSTKGRYISRIEDCDYDWYFREDYDAYSIRKGGDKERAFLRIADEEDRKRFIRYNHDHFFVIGEGFEDLPW